MARQLQQSNIGFDPAALGLQARRWVGKSEVLCPCPFHNDDDPSLCFNVFSGLWLCYGCGMRGDARKLAIHTGGVAYRTFIKVPEKESTIEWLQLLSCPLAYDNPYLAKRGVTNEQVEKFQIREHFLGVVIPLTNWEGRTVGVLMRRREGTIRYLTIGEKTPLWPLHKVKDYVALPRIPIVEGVFGVLAADRAGVPALSTLGASVKQEAARYLSILQPLVVFDNDFAGYSGAGRVLRMQPLTKVVVPGLEADELGPDEWQRIYRGEVATTADTVRLADLSGDRKKYYSRLPKFT